MNNNGVENNSNVVPAAPVLTPVPQPEAPVMVDPNTVAAAVTPQPAQPAPVAAPQPVVTQPVMTQPAVPQPTVTPVPAEPVVPTPDATPEFPAPATEEVKKKKKSPLPGLLFIILVGLGAFTYYTVQNSQRKISELNYKCTPITESKEEIHLDLESTLVKDLYQKVATSIREDYAQPNWNDTMKLYLAFRQIPDYKMYDSNCNYFSAGNMEPYTCEVSLNFVPKAFLPETLALEWKKLYGEDTPMPIQNIKLDNACIGGFEYVRDRDEFVQGSCKQTTAIPYKATKTLKDAVSSRNTIILTEEVQYAGTEKMQLPDYLKSGTYYYTFRLDMNYHYILISKTYDDKYS